MCEHKFERSLDSGRWACVRCPQIAPPCFKPPETHVTTKGMIDLILDELATNPWDVK